MKVARGDAVDVLAVAYSLEGDEGEWLGQVLDVAQARMPRASRAYALTYDATHPAGLQFETVVTRGFPEGRGRADIEFAHASLAAADVERSFGRTICATASQVLAGQHAEKLRLDTFAPFGVRDSFGVNAIDPTGRGTMLVGLLEREGSADVAAVESWTRVAAHLAAARRVRLALHGPIRGDPARHPRVDAVLDAHGVMHHATIEGDTARGALVRAAKALERVRGKTREVGDWKPLVDARWSLVDHFESDGKRYLVAVRNDAPLAGLYEMTLRERQAVGFALLGHPNKIIAYELGIATSTVGVLLGRAMRKLGVTNRSELIAACTPRAG